MTWDAATLVYGAATFCITFFITWGSTKARLDFSSEKIKELELKLDAAYDKFVTLQEFRSTVDHIRLEQSEMRRDVKRILEILMNENHDRHSD